MEPYFIETTMTGPAVTLVAALILTVYGATIRGHAVMAAMIADERHRMALARRAARGMFIEWAGIAGFLAAAAILIWRGFAG